MTTPRSPSLIKHATPPDGVEDHDNDPIVELDPADMHAIDRALARRGPTSRRGTRARAGATPEAFVDSFLWIIAAGAPTTLLTELKLAPAPGWPAGVGISLHATSSGEAAAAVNS